MADLFTIENFANLGVLIFLQAVLGFDNLLYISIESKRAPAAQQAAVRRNGIIIAVLLRIVLLFTMIQLIDMMKDPFFVFNSPGVIEGGVNFSTIVFVFGGIFIMYTAFKEITHMLTVHDLSHDVEGKSGKTAAPTVAPTCTPLGASEAPTTAKSMMSPKSATTSPKSSMSMMGRGGKSRRDLRKMMGSSKGKTAAPVSTYPPIIVAETM